LTQWGRRAAVGKWGRCDGPAFAGLGLAALRDLLVQLFEVADRSLEDIPQDLNVDELRGRPRRDLIVQRRRPESLSLRFTD
jgi:hypothetical protein